MKIAILLFSFWVLAFSCFAEEISFEVTVDRPKVSLGEDLVLNLTFYGTQSVSTPYFPGVDGFDWRYLGPSKMTSIINGEVSSSITHRYRLIAQRKGSFNIPSFSIQFRGETYISHPITVEVVSGPVSRPQPQGTLRSKQQLDDIEELIFVVIESKKKTAYVNEMIPVVIKLYINNLALRNIQFPQVEHQGFSLDEFDQPKQYQKTLNGVLYNVIEFKTNAFAAHSGQLRLGPASIECNVLIKERSGSRFSSPFFDDDFFARYRTYPVNLSSVDIPITVMDLPQQGRPADFSGAVGNYQFSLSAEPKNIKVGDPVTLKIRVSGKGNFNTVNAPELNLGDQFKLYDPDVKQGTDYKSFEQIIIPKTEKISQIPAVGFNFFNPQTGEYQQLAQGPISIKVKPLPKGEQLKIFEVTKEGEGSFRRQEVLGRDIIYIKDTPGSLNKRALLAKNRLFLLFQLMPLLAVIATLVGAKRRERLESDIGYARRLRAHAGAKKKIALVRRLLNQQKKDEFFDTVFKTLQEYLGDKFHLPTAGITANVIEELKNRQVEAQIINKITECFSNCDQARYAPASISREQMLNTFNLLEEIIGQLERVRR